jgi:hypothetical protein
MSAALDRTVLLLHRLAWLAAEIERINRDTGLLRDMARAQAERNAIARELGDGQDVPRRSARA